MFGWCDPEIQTQRSKDVEISPYRYDAGNENMLLSLKNAVFRSCINYEDIPKSYLQIVACSAGLRLRIGYPWVAYLVGCQEPMSTHPYVVGLLYLVLHQAS
jgi:hypothetical protein